MVRLYSPQSLLSVVLAFLLLFLAFPRLMAAWWALPGDPHRRDVFLARAGEEDLETFIASRKQALFWTQGDGNLWRELGFAFWAEFRRTHDQEKLSAAEEAFRKALERRPADGISWFALAKIHHLKGEDGLAVQALKRSLWTAPNDPAIFWPRISLILELDEEAQALLEKTP